MERIKPLRRAVFLSVLLAAACEVDEAPTGIGPTPEGAGPVVVFDLRKQPLPDIPLPNDVATFADPTSRTGRRIDLSLIAPTALEASLRTTLGTMEGWGTFAPITVSFAKPTLFGELAPAIGLDDVAARTRDYDPADDPFYVLDLTTGDPVPLDVGKGNFPLTLVRRDSAPSSDPHGGEDTLLFETLEEGPALGQSQYSPAIDADFDGVVDHPNVVGRPLSPPGRKARVDEVASWYDRETDTLILRPVVPLQEKHEYAVVLTDRLRGVDGAPVRSPFAVVHHVAQAAGAARVAEIFADPTRKPWFGELAGTGLAHVAFLWTFTTQPVQEDLRLLRDGLYGQGPFASFGSKGPPEAHVLPAATPGCSAQPKPAVVSADAAKDALTEVVRRALNVPAELATKYTADLASVDHFVVGTFPVPYLLGDPANEDPNASFVVDYRGGSNATFRDDVTFWLAVPKPTSPDETPRKIAVWNQGAPLRAEEMMARAGSFARQGVALMGIGVPGRGLDLDPSFAAAANAVLPDACLAPFASALASGRHPTASVATLWSAMPAHTRDLLRQGALEMFAASRLVASWNGTRRDASGGLAGDFDGDGRVDVGGSAAALTVTGDGFGGAVAAMAGALDPSIAAAAPIAGGGGLADVGLRAALDPSSPMQIALGPFVEGVPAAQIAKASGVAQTRCVDPQRSLRIVASDGVSAQAVELACLSPAELDHGKTVVVEDVTSRVTRCARTDTGGVFRIPLPTSAGDLLDVQMYDAPDAVDSYATCNAVPGAPVGRRVRAFELAASFAGQSFAAGDSLVAPASGLGLGEQTPALRRFVELTQAVLEPGDPVSYAAAYGLRPAVGPDGAPLAPHALLAVTTAGDAVVPTGTTYAFARAAGVVPFLPPAFANSLRSWAEYATPAPLFEQLGGQTPNDVLVRSWVLEGAARLGRTRAGASCSANHATGEACPVAPAPALVTAACSGALEDIDWVAEGNDPWAAPHPAIPLRLARVAELRATDELSLEASWQPRDLGAPFASDRAAWTGTRPLAAIFGAWLDPAGAHGIEIDPCKKFDAGRYASSLLVRFLATGGADLYYLTHPGSHLCLERETCPFFP